MMSPNPSYSPWSGLLTASPYGSQQAPWDAQTQAPWRLSPWSTQGMPSGSPVQSFTPQLGMIPQLSAQSFLPQGTSAGIQGFNPMTPGGGFYPGLLGGYGQGGGGGGVGGAPRQPEPVYQVGAPGGFSSTDPYRAQQMAALQNQEMTYARPRTAPTRWVSKPGGGYRQVGSRPGFAAGFMNALRRARGH